MLNWFMATLTPTKLKGKLCWKNNLFSCHDFCDVEIEEVTVEDGLDNSGHDSDDVIETLEVEAVDPVENVESAVGAEREEIVAGDGLGLAGLGDHEELGQDGDTLQVDGEGPEDLHHAELVVEQHGEERGGAEEEFHAEGVVIAVIRRLELEVHEVDGGGGAGDEEHLHDGVVDADEVGDEIQVAGDEHDQEEDLALAGDSRTAPRLPYLEEEEDDGQEVRQVTQQPEDVHPDQSVFLTVSLVVSSSENS